MKGLFSSKHSAGAINIGLLLLRLGFGTLILKHGYDKLTHFEEFQNNFVKFFGMGFALHGIASLAVFLFGSVRLHLKRNLYSSVRF